MGTAAARAREARIGDPEGAARRKLEALVDDLDARAMLDEIIEVALTAAALEPDKCNIATAVRRLGQAQGVSATHERAMELAAASLSYAFRIGPAYVAQRRIAA